MDDEEVLRLKKAILRSYGSSPHKRKVWTALLQMRVDPEQWEGLDGRRRPRKAERETAPAVPGRRKL